ncbi:MAG: hypothetical protein QM775_18715 [Pirellulales bacterium]
MMFRYSWIVLVLLLALPLRAAELPIGEQFLDNGVIRLGVDLSRGGCINRLSPSDTDRNVVNNYDLGRQIQMSFYSGPVPFTLGDKRPKPHWEHIGWNPIQTGDDFGHGSKILDFRRDDTQHEFYVRCIPMQWPLDDVPAECEFESWLRLDGATVHVRSRMVNRRSDKQQYPARHQELPAVYVNGPFYRHLSYQGPRPWTGDELTRFDTTEGKGFPWRHGTMTENWSALVDERDWGLGVWNSGCFEFSGGFAGKTGSGGTRNAPTGYISPIQTEVIDHDIDYDYRYVLILGTLGEIRDYVYTHADKQPRKPDYRFEKDRRHWRYANAHDSGWPIRGVLDVTFDAADPQLVGPRDFWQAADAPKLYVTAAFKQSRSHARLFWQRLGEAGFSEPNAVNFPIVPDGKLRTYEIDLSHEPNYQGPIIGLRIDPTEEFAPGDGVRLESVTAIPKPSP